MHSTIRTLAVLVPLLVLLVGCSGEPQSSRCPSDRELTDHFAQKQEKLDELVKLVKAHPGLVLVRTCRLDEVDLAAQGLSPTEIIRCRELLVDLGLDGVQRHSRDPLEVHLTVWYRDLFGCGGFSKGFVYAEHPISTVEESLDDYSRNQTADRVEVYRHLEGSWYLAYTASN